MNKEYFFDNENSFFQINNYVHKFLLKRFNFIYNNVLNIFLKLFYFILDKKIKNKIIKKEIKIK